MATKDKKQSTSVEIPSLETFLKAGAHFGHRTSAWHPAMEEYIYGQRDGVHIIDIIKTMKCLKDALVKIEESADKGNILIVGTKGQAVSVVEQVATESGALYINNRWPGGLFTNFNVIQKGLERLIKLEEILASGEGDYTKKEYLVMQREVDRLNRVYKGVKFMKKLPELVIVVDSKVENIAIREASMVGVPVIALLDTNCDPSLVDYPIPANDDSIKSITLFLETMGEAIKKGKKSQLLIGTRKNYQAQLDSMHKEYENRIAREKAMEEEEKQRVKRLKVGLEVSKEKESTSSLSSQEEEKTTASEESIKDLGLGTKIEKALTDAGITTSTQLKSKSKDELLKIKGVGEKAVETILSSLNK